MTTFALHVPDDLYQSLIKVAQKTGITAEELAIQYISTAVYSVNDDPLEEFIGAFTSDVPDWVEHHDRYLGQAGMNIGAAEVDG